MSKHLQNRMDPMGVPHSNPSKAAMLMGNRGILHNAEREIVRSWVGKSWVACDPHFQKIDRRPLFQAKRYSELFFLDEATAYSAGHRPCGYCQRARYSNFKSYWEQEFSAGMQLLIKQIDDQLHKDRAIRGGSKVTFESTVGELPDGTFVEIEGCAWLIQGNRMLQWSLDGYVASIHRDDGKAVSVLTPRSIVELFRRGMRANVHPSALGYQ